MAKTLWAWDLEADDWDIPLSAAAISEHGDEIYHTGKDSFKKIARDMVRIGGQWAAHFGGGYDIPLVMNHITPETLVLIGSKILSADFRRNLTLRDTFPAWQSPLAKVAEAVGMKKMDVDRSNLKDLTPQQLRIYNLHDCQILMKGMQEHQRYLADSGARNAWTSGSAALALLEALEPGSWSALSRHKIEAIELRNSLGSIRGGRVECFARGKVYPVYAYDIKSSYPSRYRWDEVGIGLKRVEDARKHFENPHAVIYCEWYWRARGMITPVLDELTGAGAGWCQAWLTFEERMLLAESSECTKIRALQGWLPLTVRNIGNEFVDALYARKETGDFFAKTFLNSLHGKFSEDPLKECWQRNEPKDWYLKEMGEQPDRVNGFWRFMDWKIDAQGMAPAHCQPIAAAQILGRARAAISEMLMMVQAAGGRVYYCDTDSIHCDLPPEKMPMSLGKKLGELNYEGGPYTGYYLGPKAYCLIDEETNKPEKFALKGVPFKQLTNGLVGGAGDNWDYSPAALGAKGRDVRIEVFERAVSDPKGVRIKKEGISSFITGVSRDDGAFWGKHTVVRTVKFCGRGKVFQNTRCNDDGWAYISPAESGGDWSDEIDDGVEDEN
jgi:hypothetical protein